jgi:ACDE family multidrug resistance protein
MRFIGVALGPPVISLLMKTSHAIMFSVIGAVSLIGVLLLLFMVKPEPDDKGEKKSKGNTKGNTKGTQKRSVATSKPRLQ